MKTLTLTLALTTTLVAGAARAQETPSPDSPPPPVSSVTVLGRSPDPLETTNRQLFGVHQQLDKGVIGPVARGYKAATPRPLRRGLRNILNNLGEPVTFINQVLQGRPVEAGETATRFVTNSTVGVLGVFDVATAAGVTAHEEDFGQTLATYGVEPGPYLFVPVVGPTSVRDLSGRVVDIALNPVNAISFGGSAALKTGAVVLNGVDARANADAEIERVNATATDPYATYRSLYLQNRAARVANGEADLEALPEFESYGSPPVPATSATPLS